MFEALTITEKRHLTAKLHHAGKEFLDEASQLAAAPDSVRAAYQLPRDGCHAFYDASIEASALSVEVWRG